MYNTTYITSLVKDKPTPYTHSFSTSTGASQDYQWVSKRFPTTPTPSPAQLFSNNTLSRNELNYLVVKKSKGTLFQNSALCIIQFLFMVCTFHGFLIVRRSPFVSVCYSHVRKRETKMYNTMYNNVFEKTTDTQSTHALSFFSQRSLQHPMRTYQHLLEKLSVKWANSKTSTWSLSND